MSEIMHSYDPSTDEEKRLKAKLLTAGFKLSKARKLIWQLKKRANNLSRQNRALQKEIEQLEQQTKR